MTSFTPLAALIGGSMIGLAAISLMMLLGHIAGISGITEETLPPWPEGEDNRWRLGFVLGIVAAPLVYAAISGDLPAADVSTSKPLLLVAGLMVGFGTAVGRGCTSGHGVCGLARLSRRSIAAVSIFLSMGMVTVYFARHVF